MINAASLCLETVTRRCQKSIGRERRERARFGMAVFAGIVREVYEIESWRRAGSTPYTTRNQRELAEEASKRWECVGRIASEEVPARIIGDMVERLFRKGQQSPLVWVGF